MLVGQAHVSRNFIELCKALTCALVRLFLPAVTLLPPQLAEPAEHGLPCQGLGGQRARQADALQVQPCERKYGVVFQCNVDNLVSKQK